MIKIISWTRFKKRDSISREYHDFKMLDGSQEQWSRHKKRVLKYDIKIIHGSLISWIILIINANTY